ncbi:hypothetical protein LGN35_27870 [Burkholderia multivorans]|nr:hypothetical protein [Burkholderia multivorans]
MNDQQQSRADALTDRIKAMFAPNPSDELGPTDEPESQYRFGYNTAIEDVLSVLAESPSSQPAAAPIAYDGLTEEFTDEVARLAGDAPGIREAVWAALENCNAIIAPQGNAAPSPADERATRLSDAEIDMIAESMPGGLTSFMKQWGWRQFARAVEDEVILNVARAASANETGAEGVAELESMTRMFHAACHDLGLINEALGLDPDDGGAEPILDAIAELRAQIASAQTDEPVAWAVYNGWSRICFYMTEEDARDHAQKAQKNHDLSGSLAAFRVVPLYAAPQPAQADAREGLTDEQIAHIAAAHTNSVVEFDRLLKFAHALLQGANHAE